MTENCFVAQAVGTEQQETCGAHPDCQKGHLGRGEPSPPHAPSAENKRAISLFPFPGFGFIRKCFRCSHGPAVCGHGGCSLLGQARNHARAPRRTGPRAGEQKKGEDRWDILLMEQKLSSKYLERKIYILLTFPIFGENPSLPPKPQAHARTKSLRALTKSSAPKSPLLFGG